MTLGIVGTGTMASAVVTGLRKAGNHPSRIFLSPRNATIAADLAARFPGVFVAESNQDVLDQCETVVLAIRPQIADSVLSSLHFRRDHQVISIVAALGIERLRGLIPHARRIARAVPLPSAAVGKSPTAIYPADGAAIDLFGLLGAAFAVDTEEQFDALCTATAVVASYFAFADGVTSWLTQYGIPSTDARDYVAQILPSLVEEAAEAPTLNFRSMGVRHATSGGLNEQILHHLESHNVFGTLSDALDQVMQRVTAASHATKDK